MSFFEKSKYILKTMLVPDSNIPEYNKEETVESTKKNEKEKQKDITTVGMSIYQLQT